jgi:hypothetical protein
MPPKRKLRNVEHQQPIQRSLSGAMPPPGMRVLPPGVQHTKEADLSAQMLWIGGNGAQRFRRRAEHRTPCPPVGASQLAGTDIYKDMSNVAWFAAMRPGADEKAFVEKSLLIDEEAIIRWREYNAMYQFVMRICLRKFESSEIANIYVFDEKQAEYLRERFGGCVAFHHVKGVIATKANKGGRPKKPAGDALTPLQKKRNQRERERQASIAAKAERTAGAEREKERHNQLDIDDRLREQVQQSRPG